MAEKTSITPPSADRLPGISVSDALGIPADWTLAESLKGEKSAGREKLEVEPEKPADAPDPDALDKQKADEKAAAEKKEADASVAADKAEADKVAADKKQKADEAAAAKTAATSGKKPATPAAKPAAGAKTPTAEEEAAAKAAAAAAAPKKIKIGDKEYTEDELKKKLEPEASPVAPKKPAEPKKEPTAEEKAAETAKQEKVETEWLAGASQALKPSAVDEETMEKILTGGKEAVEAFDRIRREDMARTVLAVRKDLGELYKPFFDAVQQMQQGHMASEDERMWGEFSTAHPELASHRNVVEQHAQALVEADPAAVAKMGEKEFNAKVAELTIGYIRQFNPKFGEPAEGAAPAAAPAGDPAAVTAAAKTLADAAKAKAATEAAAKRKTPAPPAGSLPAGAPSSGGGRGGGADFQKSAVASLM